MKSKVSSEVHGGQSLGLRWTSQKLLLWLSHDLWDLHLPSLCGLVTLGPSQLESGGIFTSLTCVEVLDLRPTPAPPFLKTSDVSLLNVFLLKLPDEMQGETQVKLG